MKVIVAGSRDIENVDFHVTQAIETSFFFQEITEIVSGCARGVDRSGENYAYINNIPVSLFPADWVKHGKSAGYIRNEEMARHADALIAVWDGKSKGTKHMMDIADRYNLPSVVYTVNQ